MAQPRRADDLYEIQAPAHHLRPGPPPPPSVTRPELVRRVEDGMAGRLVMLTAPAGWGKTNVLAEWASATGMAVAWVNCERIGNNPGRFVRAIVSSLSQVFPDFGGDLFAMLRSARPLPTEQLLAALADAIVDHGRPLALVLDDFHSIEDPELVDGIRQLVISGPENLRLVIAGRDAPNWPVARLRVDGDIVEIGIRDLAFTHDEAASLLGEVGDSNEIVDTLLGSSEGWAAGLRLGQLWWRHHGDRTNNGAPLAGTNRDVADYLAEEVLSGLPADTVRFLTATSVVDRFSAPLAGALAGLDHPEAILESIERQELFVTPLDPDRRWYRYHDLFRQFLRERLSRSDPGAETQLQRTAADWFAQHDMPLEGVASSIAAGDFEAAAGMVDGVAERLLLRDGETVTLIRLVEQLPRDVVRRFPRLYMFFAWALVLVGRLSEAESISHDIGERIEADDAVARQRRAEIASICSRIAAYRGDHAATISYASEALENCGPEMDRIRADCLLSIGFAYRALGQMDRACDSFGRVSELGWTTGFVHGALWGSRYQALTFATKGNLRDAEALIEANMERAREAGMSNGPTHAALLVTRGELRYERNDLAGARQDLEQALALAREVSDAKILMNVLVALAKLRFAEGDMAGGIDTAHRATKVFDGEAEKALEAWLALRRNDLAFARRWAQGFLALAGDRPDLSRGETEPVMLGRAMLALGDIAGATDLLGRLLAEAEETGRVGIVLTLHILLARAADESGDDDGAAGHVREAVDIAMRERYVRSILDEGPAFLRLLRRTMRQDTSRERRRYAAVLLAAAEGPADAGAPIASDSLAEPLTPRQEEVLRLMVDGSSNREIADALYVAEGTVKAHVNQIFGKLMVRNRSEAIQAARRIGIGSDVTGSSTFSTDA